MQQLKKRGRRLDSLQRRHAWMAFPYAVIKKFGDDRGGSLASLIAYYGFFSISPLLLVLVTGLAFVLGPRTEISATALQQFPIIGAELRSGSLSGSGAALAVGSLAALWAGTGVISAMQDAMNQIWNARSGASRAR